MDTRSQPVTLEALPPSAKTHPAPDLSSVGFNGEYSSSPDGIDTNLLILFHGLGQHLSQLLSNDSLMISHNFPSIPRLAQYAISILPRYG